MTKQTVYLPVNGEYLTAVCHFEYSEWCHHETVQSNEGYFFTPEQLNEYNADVIKQALETAAENAKITYNKILFDDPKEGDDAYMEIPKVNKQSITNTFEETFKLFEV